MVDTATLEVIKIFFSPSIAAFSSVVVVVVGWVRSSKERAIAAEAGMREFRLKTCQSEMKHFCWIPQHGDSFSHELTTQFYINFSKLSEFGHLVLSDIDDMDLGKMGRSIHKKLLVIPHEGDLNKDLIDEILIFLESGRSKMKKGVRDLIAHA